MRGTLRKSIWTIALLAPIVYAGWWLASPRVYFQVTVPEDCQLVSPRPLGGFPGGAFLYAPPGVREFTFECSGKRYTLPLKVGDDETYRGADPRRPNPEDLRCR